jgi:hypothetical protein
MEIRGGKGVGAGQMEFEQRRNDGFPPRPPKTLRSCDSACSGPPRRVSAFLPHQGHLAAKRTPSPRALHLSPSSPRTSHGEALQGAFFVPDLSFFFL